MAACAASLLGAPAVFAQSGAQSSDRSRVAIRLERPPGADTMAYRGVACDTLYATLDGIAWIASCSIANVVEVEVLDGGAPIRVFGVARVRSEITSQITAGAIQLPVYPSVIVDRYFATRADAEAALVPDAPQTGQVLDIADIPLAGAGVPVSTSEAPVETADVTTDTGPAIAGGTMDKAPDTIPFVTSDATPAAAVEKDQPAASPQADDPSTPVEAAHTYLVFWEAWLGQLATPPGVTLEFLTYSAENAVNVGNLRIATDVLNDDAAALSFVSGVNPACVVRWSATRDAGSSPDTPLTAPECRRLVLGLPGGVVARAQMCASGGSGSLICVLEADDSVLPVDVTGWGVVEVELDPEGMQDTHDGAAAQLRLPGSAVPDIRLDPGAQLDQCGERSPGLSFLGYCTGSEAADCTPTELTFEANTFPALDQASFDGAQVPTHVLLSLAGSATSDPQVIQVPLSREGMGTLEAALAKARGRGELPLRLSTLADHAYGVERRAVFFQGPGCTGPRNATLDLSIPGLPVPEAASICGSLWVEESGRPVTECASLERVEDAVLATVPDNACDADRVVVFVAQNKSLDGFVAQATRTLLRELMVANRDSDTCRPVDFAYSQNERRDVLVTAEGAYFGTDPRDFAGVDRLEYVSPTSAILRDLGWIYRRWGQEMRALVLIADGSQAFAADMVDSPEALAWEILGIRTVVIDVGAQDNCAMFEETLYFDDCIRANANTLGDEVRAALEDSL